VIYNATDVCIINHLATYLLTYLLTYPSEPLVCDSVARWRQHVT